MKEGLMIDEILKDEKIIELYKNVDVDDDKFFAYHGLSHVLSVMEQVKSILQELNQSDEMIENGMIAGYLHDVGMIAGKTNHAEKSAEIVKDVLDKYDISDERKQLILEAIECHRSADCQNKNNLVSNVLLFADKLDISKTRIARAGFNVDGLKEIRHIEKIDIKISDKIIINFVTDSNFKKNEFEKYYFCKKVFDAIKSFANFLRLDYQVLIDNQEWTFEENNKMQ